MKWNKAIEQIEKALADGKVVEVSFHRKWARNCNEFKTDRVDCVSAYDWHGETCKGVSTFEGYGLDEGNFIIDDVIVADEQTEEPAADMFSNLTYDEDGVPCITLGGCDEDQEEPTEAERPESGWTYLYTDTNTYNVDMDVYRTEDGRLVMVDSDWMF